MRRWEITSTASCTSLLYDTALFQLDALNESKSILYARSNSVAFHKPHTRIQLGKTKIKREDP